LEWSRVEEKKILPHVSATHHSSSSVNRDTQSSCGRAAECVGGCVVVVVGGGGRFEGGVLKGGGARRAGGYLRICTA
jgi:hypothetical protein